MQRVTYHHALVSEMEHECEELSEAKRRLYWRNLAQFILKYTPVLIMFNAIYFCAIRAAGRPIPGLAEFMLSLSPFYFVQAICCSKYMGFCKLHRRVIIYSFLVYLCIFYERYFGFGEIRWIFNLFFALWGVCLSIRVLHRIKHHQSL